jgi:hypothetical protein
LLALARVGPSPRLRHATTHGLVNGAVLGGFVVLTPLAWAAYPAIAHGCRFLGIELGLSAAMLAGNYFGGAVV